MALLRRFVREEEGLETVEYAVIAAVILAVTVGTMSALGGAIDQKFKDLKDRITGN